MKPKFPPNTKVYVEIDSKSYWTTVKFVYWNSDKNTFQYVLHGLKGYLFDEKEVQLEEDNGKSMAELIQENTDLTKSLKDLLHICQQYAPSLYELGGKFSQNAIKIAKKLIKDNE